MIQFRKSLLHDGPLWVATSGGPDSMAVLDFLSRGHRSVGVAYFNHGTPHGQEAEGFVLQYAQQRGMRCVVGHLDGTARNSRTESPESYWRGQRYKFFDGLPGQVVTAHHLDDVMEWWIFSALRGQTKLINWTRNPNVVRPFLQTRKTDLVRWCERKGVPYIIDPSNMDTRYTRNLIRHNLMPHALGVNPGLHTTIRKLLAYNGVQLT